MIVIKISDEQDISQNVSRRLPSLVVLLASIRDFPIKLIMLRDHRYKKLVIRDTSRLLAHIYCNYGLRAKKSRALAASRYL